MDTQIIAIFCLCDGVLEVLNHRDDPQSQMTEAEIMATAILVALQLEGNFEHAIKMH